jgi:O-antigen/teichoic acid export membrane protein
VTRSRQAKVPDQPAGAGSPSSSSTLQVGVGLLVLGLSGFVFLGLSGRDLGPAATAPVSVLWTILNAVGIGLFMPLEQEVGRRISAARARGDATPPLSRVRRYAAAALGTLAVVALVFSGPIADTFLGGSRVLVVVLVLALAAQALEYYARGILAGTGRFRRYGAQLAVDGASRMVLSAALFLLPASSAELYAAVLVVSPVLATLTTIPLRDLLRRDAHARPGERYPMAPLVTTSVTAQLVANAGPLAIAVLAAPGEEAVTGQFVAAITIGRVPLFLFAAVQAVFLPSLAALVTTGRHEEFRSAMRRGGAATALLGAAGVVGIAVLGRWAMRLIYGPAFDVSVLDITLIALSGALFMVAQLLAQGLLAHKTDTVVALGWGLGIVVTVLSLLLPLATTTTVALALCTGSGAAMVFFAVALHRTTTSWVDQLNHHTENR